MLQTISLNKIQREQHVKYLTELGEKFPTVVEPMLENIKVLSAISVMYPLELLHSLESKFGSSSEGTQKFITALKKLNLVQLHEHNAKIVLPSGYIDAQIQRHSNTMQLFLVLGMNLLANRQMMISIDAKAYYQGHGYILLLGSLVGYNLAQFYALKNQHEEKIKYLNKCFDWMTIFETECLAELDDDFCFALRSTLAKKIKDLQVAPLKLPLNNAAYADPYLVVDELRQLVDYKNTKATEYGTPCKKIVIQAPSTTLYSLDLDTLNLLKPELIKIIQGKVTEPRHFLFYCNQELGPVEFLAVNYNMANKTLDLVSISPGKHVAQFYFLISLSMFLESNEIPYRLLACQANVQASENSSQFYAYLLSGIMASTSFENLIPKVEMAQPQFYDPHEKKLSTAERLQTVRWFSLAKLGPKALLLAPTPEQRLALFQKHYGIDGGLQRYNYCCRKYGLLNHSYFQGAFHHYYEYAYHQTKIFFADRVFIERGQEQELESVRRNRQPPLFEIENSILDDDFDVRDEEKLVDIAKELESLLPQLEKLKIEAANSKDNAKQQPQQCPKPSLVLAANQSYKLQSAKLLRRAASGYCPLSHFAVLLSQPSMLAVINDFDPQQKYNPLQLALSNQQPKRAMMLLEAHADINALNNQGKSAKMIYAELPEDSPVKRNTKLRGLLSFSG